MISVLKKRVAKPQYEMFDEKFKSTLSALCKLHEFVNNVYLSRQY
jgi:hypothetical protein